MEPTAQAATVRFWGALIIATAMTGCGPSKPNSQEICERIPISRQMSRVASFPWRRKDSDMKFLLSKASLLKHAMSAENVVALMGAPDVVEPIPRKTTDEPDKGFSMQYFLSKVDQSPHLKDEMLMIFFSPKGEQLSVLRIEGGNEIDMLDAANRRSTGKQIYPNRKGTALKKKR